MSDEQAIAKQNETIVDMIAGGESLRKACQSVGITAPTFCERILKNPALAEQYARAREMRSDIYGEQVGEIAGQVLRGELEPDAARVAADCLKWTAGRMAPKKWGDKVEVDHGGTVKQEHVILNVPRPRLIGEAE